MGERAAKDALYDGFAEVARALASGRRAELVDVLAQGERSVDEVAAEIGQSVANTSHHLRALARAGLVHGKRGFGARDTEWIYTNIMCVLRRRINAVPYPQ